MKWKVVSASMAVLVFVGMALSDSYNGAITGIKDGKVTFQKMKKGDDKKLEKDGDPIVLPVSADVKVAKRGKVDKDTKSFNAGDAIEGGLKNEIFEKIGDKGLNATITTDADNKKITQILVGGGKKGK